MNKTEFTFHEPKDIQESEMSRFQPDDEVVYFQDRRWHVGTLAGTPDVSQDGKRVVLHLQQPEPDQTRTHSFDVELVSLPKRATFRLMEQVVCDGGYYDVFEVHAGHKGEVIYDLLARDGKSMLRRVPEEKLQVESAVQGVYGNLEKYEKSFLRRIQNLQDKKYPQLMEKFKATYDRMIRLYDNMTQAGYDKNSLDEVRQSIAQVEVEIRDELQDLKQGLGALEHEGKSQLLKTELDPKKVVEAFILQKRELEKIAEPLKERAQKLNDVRVEATLDEVQKELSELSPDRSDVLTIISELRTKLRSADLALIESEHRFDFSQKPKKEKQIETIDIPASLIKDVLHKHIDKFQVAWEAAHDEHQERTVQALQFFASSFESDVDVKQYAEQLQQPNVLDKVARGLLIIAREEQKADRSKQPLLDRDLSMISHLFAAVVRHQTMPDSQRVIRVEGERIKLTTEDALLYHEMLDQMEHAEGVVPTEQTRLQFARLLYDLRHNEKVGREEKGDEYFPPGITGSIRKALSNHHKKEVNRTDEQTRDQIKESVALINDSLEAWKTEKGDFTGAELFEYRSILLAMLGERSISSAQFDYIDPKILRFYQTHAWDVVGVLQRDQILRTVVENVIREIDRSGIVEREGVRQGLAVLRDKGDRMEKKVTNSSSVQFAKLLKRWERTVVYGTVAIAASAVLGVTGYNRFSDDDSQQEVSSKVDVSTPEKSNNIFVPPEPVEQPHVEPKATVEWFVSKAVSAELGLRDVISDKLATPEQLKAWTRQWATANPDKLQDYYAIRDFKDWVRNVKVHYPDALAPGEDPNTKKIETVFSDEILLPDEPSEEVEAVVETSVTRTAPLAIEEGEKGDPMVYLYNNAKPSEPFSFSIDKDYKPKISEDKHTLLLQKEGQTVEGAVYMAMVDDEQTPVFTITFDDGITNEFLIRGGQLVAELDNSLVFAD